MGRALIVGALQSSLLAPKQILLSRRRLAALESIQQQYGVEITTDNARLLAQCDLILIAVKPQNFDELWAQTQGHFNSNHRVISVAAGVTTQRIEASLGLELAVARAMPNMPALIGRGMSAFCLGRHAGLAHAKQCEQLFSTVGEVVQVEEELMDAVTAVSGSGPAYLFLMAEAMQSGAEKLGLSKELSETLVQQTLLGAATLLAESADSAATLRQNVSSPKGTTAAALEVLSGGQFERLMESALKAARDRALELGKD